MIDETKAEWSDKFQRALQETHTPVIGVVKDPYSEHSRMVMVKTLRKLGQPIERAVVLAQKHKGTPRQRKDALMLDHLRGEL